MEYQTSAKAILLDPDDNMLALQRIATAHRRPEQWDLVGGKLKPGETLEDGLLREAWEETGLEIPFSAFQQIENGAPKLYEDGVTRKKTYYLGRVSTFDYVRLDPTEHQAQRVMTLPEAYQSFVHPPHRKLIKLVMTRNLIPEQL